MSGPQAISTGVSHQIGRNVTEILSQGGAELTDIVSVRQWLTRSEDIPAYVAVRSHFVKHEPAFMLGVVSMLIRPEVRVEIEVTAAVPAGSTSGSG